VFDVLIDVVLPVLLVAGIGGVAGRRIGLSNETMSAAVFFLFSPALVFTSMSTANLHSSAVARIALVAVGVFALNALLGFAWSRVRRSDPRTRAVAVVGAAVPNLGNMGLPMARLAFGARGLEIGIMIFVIGVILSSSAAVAVGTLAVGEHSRRGALLAPLRYPSIYAAAVGVAVNLGGVRLPALVRDSVGTLGQASIPCMLVVLGLSFTSPGLRDLGEPLAAGINRLVIGPLGAWALTLLVGLEGVARGTSIMMAGMPSAVATTILAAQLRANVPLAVRIVVVSTLCSIATLTVLIALVR
jgi:predicted permease